VSRREAGIKPGRKRRAVKTNTQNRKNQTSFFLKGVNPMTSMQSATMPEVKTAAEPLILRKRIGSTTFEVSVHFSGTSKETLADKMLRLILSESAKIGDFSGRGEATERSEYPPQGGCSGVQSAPTKREAKESA
jgi:hypothetical protein